MSTSMPHLGKTVIVIWLVASVGCQAIFHMTNMTTVPTSGPNNIVPENQTLHLYGQSNIAYTLCSLYFKDKFLCRNSRAPTCDPSMDPVTNTSRLGTVGIQQMDDPQWCGFQVPNISSLDSGKWKIEMIYVASDILPDSDEAIVMVSTRTTIELTLSATEVSAGDTLSANCTSSGGLPRVTSFSWAVQSTQDNTTAHWNFTQGEVLQDGGRTSQGVSVQPQYIGSFMVSCSAEQAGYYGPITVEEEVLVSAPVDPETGDEGALDKFTITFIVLGAVFIVIIVIWIIVAAITGTFCFAATKPEEKREAKKKAKKEDDTIRTDDKNIVADTKYVVGQDFKNNDHRSSQASESLSLQYQQGRPSGFMPAGQYPQSSSQYPKSSSQYPQGSRQYPQGSRQYPQGSSQYPQGTGQYGEYDQGSEQLDESGDSMEPKNFRRQPHLYTGQTRDSLRMENKGALV